MAGHKNLSEFKCALNLDVTLKYIVKMPVVTFVLCGSKECVPDS